MSTHTEDEIQDLVLEVNTALADALELFERSKAVLDEFKGAQERAPAAVAQPEVMVNVNPTPITMAVEPTPIEIHVAPAQVNIPPPVVHLVTESLKTGTGWKFDFETTPAGFFKSMTARRI